jgi:hypothetical protein
MEQIVPNLGNLAALVAALAAGILRCSVAAFRTAWWSRFARR